MEEEENGDTSLLIKEVVITGFQPSTTKMTSINIEPFFLKDLQLKTPFNLSDALAKIPGISQMSTGNSISKPVIRGLYGNRILVLLSGIRFDNQQWQDEHGLGLSQIGIDRVELIKGPASLIYGTDAIGGVINVIEENPLNNLKFNEKLPVLKIDAGTVNYSNTLGTLTHIGISKVKPNNSWWRIRLGTENHTDYSDGHNQRVLNSRNNGYYLKAGFGFQKANWKQENSYNFSLNNYGFILNELTSFFKADSRYERAMNGPHHIVMLNVLNSQNTFKLKSSMLYLNVGIQSNSRKEDEGSGTISLNMHLVSALQNLKWDKALNSKFKLTLNQQFAFINNTNYGGRIIIPDATSLEENISGYLKYSDSKWVAEFGLGINHKNIQTFLTRSLNAYSADNEFKIYPFQINRFSGNAMVGGSYNPNNKTNIKANVSSGYRAPNLAELSSNGLHEGVYRYEIGDPNMKVEQNINSDITYEVMDSTYLFNASVYYNHFNDYIYLTPIGRSIYTFPVFKYKQQNADIFGFEAIFSWSPKVLKYIQIKNSFTYTKGKLADGGYLPFIPAYKYVFSLKFEKKRVSKKVSNLFFQPEINYNLKQKYPAQFETYTPDYYLLHFYSGATFNHPKGKDLKLGLNVTNILNRAYYDHLSRLKYYGLQNQGINFVISLAKTF